MLNFVQPLLISGSKKKRICYAPGIREGLTKNCNPSKRMSNGRKDMSEQIVSAAICPAVHPKHTRISQAPPSIIEKFLGQQVFRDAIPSKQINKNNIIVRIASSDECPRILEIYFRFFSRIVAEICLGNPVGFEH